MSEEENYLRAGRIAAEVLKQGEGMIREGASVLEICEELEEMIRKRGAVPAFPVNLTQNNEAAHYTASPDDNKKIVHEAVVKLDLGASVDGFLSDTALTVSLSPAYRGLVEANRALLDRALAIVRHGLPFHEFGSFIERTAKSMGYKPIENLMGHRLERFVLHAGESVPMIASPIRGQFISGKAYAVEPFLVDTSSKGFVIDGVDSNIYRLPSPPRKGLGENERGLLTWIYENYRTLPFATRWVAKEWGAGSVETIRELARKGVLQSFNVLLEASGGTVSQFEHTVYVKSDATIITTKA